MALKKITCIESLNDNDALFFLQKSKNILLSAEPLLF